MKIHKLPANIALAVLLNALACSTTAHMLHAQASAPLAATAPTPVPALVPFSGTDVGFEGKPVTREASITFEIFKDEKGGEPLWAETQTVVIDPTGHYKVQLGAAATNGLPSDLFATGEARWLEVQIAGEVPQPRVLLASVPYALKAGDATTLGGLPASAYVHAGTENVASGNSFSSPAVTGGVTTTGGTSGYLPVFTGADTTADSIVFQSSNGIGIGTTSPAAKLDVDGTVDLRGLLTLEGAGAATTETGKDSQALAFAASAWNSTTGKTQTPVFQWQAEPFGNDTATPTATLNLLSSNGAAALSETGLLFNSNGTIKFAPGQTFPGTGPGTLTGVTAGAGLTGGGTSGNVTLSVNPATTPQLAAANNFTASQTIGNGNLNLPATTGPNSGVLYLGGVPFLQGYTKTNNNVFVGGAGNFTTTAYDDAALGYAALASQVSGGSTTAVGSYAMYYDTSGYENTAVGLESLYGNATGYQNTAVGTVAGFFNVSGNRNTALGFYSGQPNSTSGAALSNTTAVGAFATVSQNNTLILGNTTTSPGAEFVNVGIGTATPKSVLEASVSAAGKLGPTLTLTNPGGGTNSAASIDLNTYTPTGSNYTPSTRIEALDDGNAGNSLYFLSNKPGAQDSGFQTNMVIQSDGNLQVQQGAQIGWANVDTFGNPLHYSGTFEVFGGGDVAGIAAIGSVGGHTGVVGQGGNGQSTNAMGSGGEFFGGENYGTGAGGVGIYAEGGSGGSVGNAGVFLGNVEVSGTLNGSMPLVKIDDPSDPADKYLVHATVASSEMMNIYTGNVTTNELGVATVTMPDWFQGLNSDLRYQLTVVGGRFAQAIVSKEMENNQFTISTNASNVKVSWQITAIRQDAYAKAHSLVVEQEKPANERGFYIHPELFGQPAEKQTEWGRHPQRTQASKPTRQTTETIAPAADTSSPQLGPPASAVDRAFIHPDKPALKPIAAVKH